VETERDGAVPAAGTTSPAFDWDGMILVGRITRPHGLKGQVVIHPETDFVEQRFAAGATCWTRSAAGDEKWTIASCRLQNGRVVVGFEGLDRIEEVERLAGLELRVPEASLQPLGPGVYYEHQLVGCEVRTTGGTIVGPVVKVEGGGAASRLVISGKRGDVQIPLAVDICVDIDVTGRTIRINAPEGLLELNER